MVVLDLSNLRLWGNTGVVVLDLSNLRLLGNTGVVVLDLSNLRLWGKYWCGSSRSIQPKAMGKILVW